MIFMALFWTCSSRSMSFLRAGGLRAEHSTLKEQVPWRWRECSSRSKRFSGREPSHLASSPCYPEVFLDRASSFQLLTACRAWSKALLETSHQATIPQALLAPFLHAAPPEHPSPPPHLPRASRSSHHPEQEHPRGCRHHSGYTIQPKDT